MPRTFAWTVFAATLALFGCFFFWPLFQILKGGFINADGVFTLDYLKAVLTTPIYREGLINAFNIGVCSTALSMLIGVPLALMANRFRFPGKALLGSLILIPMILPPFVGAIGLRQIFGQTGALNALIIALGLRPEGWMCDWFAASPFWGIVLITALSLYPIIYLNAAAALANIDPAMDEAAQSLGCTGFRRFSKITLPLMRPGLFAGGTLVFIWSFTELGVPLIFDYSRVTSVQIFDGLKEIGGNPFPYALVVVLLTSTLAIYALGKGIFGQDAHAMNSRASRGATAKPLPPLAAWACTLAFSGITLFAMLPHIGVVLMSFARDWYGSVLPASFTLENFRLGLGHELTVPAIANSLKFASFSTLIDIALGVAIAWVVVRSRLPGRTMLDHMSMLPLSVPGLILAFGFLAMSQEGSFFAFLNPIENPTLLLIIAYAIRRLPYVVRSAIAGFQQTSVTLEEAAQSLGCPPVKGMCKITLPLITANLIAGGLLAFAFAMLEVSDSLILAQKQAFYPITKAILELFQRLGDGQFIASALGVWAMAFLGITLVGMTVLLGKKLGALFRA